MQMEKKEKIREKEKILTVMVENRWNSIRMDRERRVYCSRVIQKINLHDPINQEKVSKKMKKIQFKNRNNLNLPSRLSHNNLVFSLKILPFDHPRQLHNRNNPSKSLLRKLNQIEVDKVVAKEVISKMNRLKMMEIFLKPHQREEVYKIRMTSETVDLRMVMGMTQARAMKNLMTRI